MLEYLIHCWKDIRRSKSCVFYLSVFSILLSPFCLLAHDAHAEYCCCHQESKTTDTDEEYGVVITGLCCHHHKAVIISLITDILPYYLFLFTVNTAAAGPGYCITLQTAECRQLARVECGAGCWQQGHGQCSMWRLGGGWSLEPELTLTLQPRPDSGTMILCSM